MTYIQAIIMGVVQGLAEFLPISSSGHLVIMGDLLQISDSTASDMFLDVILHFGTFLAVIVAFWRDIIELIKELLSAIGDAPKGKALNVQGRPYRNFLFMMILSLIPLFLVLPIRDLVEELFGSPLFVGFALIATSAILFTSSKFTKTVKSQKDIKVKDAFIIGFAQLFAIIPGISRSGTTITAGLFAGLRREIAVKYSFIISLPATLAAAMLTLYDAIKADALPDNLAPYIVGMLAAFVSGYIAIGAVNWLVKGNKFNYFAVYCFIVGAITVVLNFN